MLRILVSNMRTHYSEAIMCQFRKSSRKVGNTHQSTMCKLFESISTLIWFGLVSLSLFRSFVRVAFLPRSRHHKHAVCFHVCLIECCLSFSSALLASHPFSYTLFLYISASSSSYFVSLF